MDIPVCSRCDLSRKPDVELNRYAVGITALAPLRRWLTPFRRESQLLASRAPCPAIQITWVQKLCPTAQFNEVVSGQPTRPRWKRLRASAVRITFLIWEASNRAFCARRKATRWSHADSLVVLDCVCARLAKARNVSWKACSTSCCARRTLRQIARTIGP
jgi:hypothetical protein